MIDYVIEGWGNFRRYFQSGPILKKQNKTKKTQSLSSTQLDILVSKVEGL